MKGKSKKFKRTRVVAIGGGAISEAVLPALKNLKLSITTITSMTDSGGSTGALRREFDVHPAGDIRRHILALSEAEKWKKDIWKFRFANDIVFDGGHKGHSFANVFMAGLEKSTGNFEKTLKIAHEFMKVKGICLPATVEKINLFAKLEDGRILKSEAEVEMNEKLKIDNLWLETDSKTGATAYPKAIQAIRMANYIVIGPGDLYSSIIACFLAKGIKEAIQKTKAKIIYVCNISNKPGDALEILKYTGLKKIDYVLANNLTLKPKGEAVKADKKQLEKLADKVILADLADRNNSDHHDYKKVERIIKNIL